MAATKQQGQWFGLFLAGLTLACAGIAGYSSSLGKAALILGVVIIAASFWKFAKLKPLEGRVALGSQPAITKLVGLLVTVFGWLVVLLGLHFASGVGGRMVLSIAGLILSLVGMVVILPAACNKNAIWKS
ncbi:MAG: hypothetical protein ACRD3F_05155 [Acidobacteriaceae bacterium]